MNAIHPAEYQAALRADFYSFLLRCFAELNPRSPFLANWHIEVLAAKLQAAQEGKINRLVVCIPPRHLKSLAASIALPAWWLGHDPACAIINVTYGQDLSDKFARDCRAIMMSSWYQKLYPTRLATSRAAIQELVTTKGGFRMATSVSGVLTGRGADVIIVHDPLKPIDAMSDARRNAANEWYDGTLILPANISRPPLHPQFYLLNVLRKKLAYFDLKRAIHDQHLLFNPSVILIEDKASGTQLIQELIEAGLSKVTRYKPDGDKIMRLHAQTATIENGFVHLPREAHWLADYLHELTVFPNGRYDDQVDFDVASTRLDEAKTVGMGHSRILPTTGRHRDRPHRAAARPPKSTAGHLACLYVEWAAVSRSGRVCVGPRRRCTAPNKGGICAGVSRAGVVGADGDAEAMHRRIAQDIRDLGRRLSNPPEPYRW